jgi:hypothetical protein
MMKPPGDLIEFLCRYDPAVQSLALGLRRVVLEEMVPCHEYIFEMRSKIVLLYGPTEHAIRDGICYINVFRRHVNLGFQHGADLKDACQALHGVGKAMRHLTLRNVAELDRPELRTLIREARKRAGHKRSRRTSSDDVVTRVKPKRLVVARLF